MKIKNLLAIVACLPARCAANICDRHPHIVDRILYEIGKNDCATVTEEDLDKVNALYIYYEYPTNNDQGGKINGTIKYNSISGKFMDLRTRQVRVHSEGERSRPEDMLSELRPEWLEGLVNLKVISIENSDIAELSSQNFLGLGANCNGAPCLEELTISHNLITEIPDNAFATLKNLQKMDIDSMNDRYTYEVPLKLNPKSFAGLTSLKKLDLDKSYLEQLPSGIFADNRALTELDLGGNNLSQFTTATFKTINANGGVVILTKNKELSSFTKKSLKKEYPRINWCISLTDFTNAKCAETL